MKQCLVYVALLTLTSLVWGNKANDIARMLEHYPESDANKDGTLTEDEAGRYFMRNFQRKRPNRGTGIGDQSLIDLYEARNYQGMPYRLLKPLALKKGQQVPLIVSLHGSGGVGTDNRSNLRDWNRVMAQESWRKKYPSVVIAPQRRPGGIWGPKPDDERVENYYVRNDLETVFQLIEEMKSEFPIDDSRIYVLGSSGGGIGTWNAVVYRPEVFAAAIPVCGRFPYTPEQIEGIKDIPIWCFHGDADQLVDVEESRKAFSKMSKHHAVMKYTELQDVRHNSWVQAFRYQGDDEAKGYVTSFSNDRCDKTTDTWEWLFSQEKP